MKLILVFSEAGKKFFAHQNLVQHTSLAVPQFWEETCLLCWLLPEHTGMVGLCNL